MRPGLAVMALGGFTLLAGVEAPLLAYKTPSARLFRRLPRATAAPTQLTFPWRTKRYSPAHFRPLMREPAAPASSPSESSPWQLKLVFETLEAGIAPSDPQEAGLDPGTEASGVPQLVQVRHVPEA